MPYPHKFKPNTTVTVDDARGHVQAGLIAQVYKPLLGCSFNGPQTLILGHVLHNNACAVLRALTLVPAGSPLDIRPGPEYWFAGRVPALVLSEDPNGEKWYWTDALPWSYPGGKLWSVFASKDSKHPPDPPPDPPPPDPPLYPGVSCGTAGGLTIGVVYADPFVPPNESWGVFPAVIGVTYTIRIAGMSSPLTLTTALVGPCGGQTIIGPGITQNGTMTIVSPVTGSLYVRTYGTLADAGTVQVTSP